MVHYIRLFVGLGIIGFALWIIVGEQIAGASADAFVNARLTTIRAPIAGTLTIPDRALGSPVREGEEVGSIMDPLTDTIRRNDLAMERAFAQAELAAATARLDAIDQALLLPVERLSAFTVARVKEIEARLAEARDRLATLENRADDDAAVEELGRTTEDEGNAAIARSYAREQVSTLEITAEAARQGVFLGDGYNDAPYSEQWRTEVEARRDMLAIDRDLATTRLSAVEQRLSQEQVRTSNLGGQPLLSPASGVIWEMLAAHGETVQRGQDVMRVADCQSVVVSVSVTENVYNRLAIGDPATVRLAGERRVFPGTVLRLAGSGALAIYQNLAVTPSRKHLERYDVTLLVPALRSDPGLNCVIGRTGRVFFEDRPLDVLRSLWP